MTHILKAMPEGSQEAVGFAIIRVFGRERADRNRDEGAEVSGAKGVDIDGGDLEVRDSSVDGLNHEFCEVWLKRMKDVYEGCVGGKNHACRCRLSLYNLLNCSPPFLASMLVPDIRLTLYL